MAKTNVKYDNDSIQKLEGPDRVRKRPGVIFGSDGLDGCEHSAFEIISNSIDEAREGFGNKIVVTKYSDGSIEVQDFGRGAPVDFNNKEQCFNWELLYCELYAGGKYNTNDGANYEYSVGLNGLGLCSTQYSSEYMDVEIKRDGFKYNLHFEKGYNVGGLKRALQRTRYGHKNPLETRFRGFYRNRYSRRVFSRYFKAPSHCKRRVAFCFSRATGQPF